MCFVDDVVLIDLVPLGISVQVLLAETTVIDLRVLCFLDLDLVFVLGNQTSLNLIVVINSLNSLDQNLGFDLGEYLSKSVIEKVSMFWMMCWKPILNCC
ncbi:MAG: hypothetical protein EZS28_032663 [Streblomastix strix]|uniref:Uncharacterized protein n=1 Tax=Streblomastix strix TaxID=222440 RepID=A0A5J4UP96_9EUKA|nr:MAG: hypothetical protein EZS28_032663 [Streblomastix strix]